MLGLSAVALIGGAWLLHGEAPAAPQERASIATASVAPVPAAPAPEPPSPAPGQREPLAIPKLRGLADRAAEDYRDRARFPPWSRPLPEGRDPLREDRDVVPARSLPPTLVPGLVIRTAKTGFVRPEPVVVHAVLQYEGQNVAAANLRGEIRDARDELVATLAFRDDGLGADEQAGDLDFAAEASPGQTADAWRGAYLVSVAATTRQGELRAATTGFLYSAPLATATGRFRDSVVEGDLVLDVEIEVQQSSRFHVEATLADTAGAPLAWSQNAGSLEPGRHWFPLTFYGLALRESGRDGPYVVRSLALTTVDGIPNQKSELLRDPHRTRAYEALDFHGDPYEDPSLLEAAEALERR